jgi:hypothetical protein
VAVQPDYEWITPSRARVLRELAAFRTEREAALNLGITYEGVRSIVEAIKEHTDLASVREIGRWWLAEAPKWAGWAAEQGGVRLQGRDQSEEAGTGGR